MCWVKSEANGYTCAIAFIKTTRTGKALEIKHELVVIGDRGRRRVGSDR